MATPALRDIERHVDDRGDLAEVFRVSWDMLPDIRQVYLVTDPAAGTIRAFHRHRELWDLFHVVSGSALFWLIAPGFWASPADPVERGKRTQRHILSDRKPQILIVPPGWYHGWMSLEPMTRLLSIASHEYNREAPDEERVPFDSFSVTWGVQPK